MSSDLYLAMTGAEIQSAGPSLPRLAWMACHFSPYASGLSSIPEQLPEDSLLILSDMIPIHGHDPSRIAAQLEECVRLQRCRGILLDFQRAPNWETKRLADYLLLHLPFPIAISDAFANETCPVFLPPCPPYTPLQDYLLPWQGREIWLELSLSPTQITLTDAGPEFRESDIIPGEKYFAEENLHCHYQICHRDPLIHFHLWRNGEDLLDLMETAKALGVRQFVGLYQELHTIIY